ncbi:hypothetical protein RRG08_034881 [Elysia crispata]|uniref:Uncharacterized protein n=1 Tax=Elysia crispata TaxID=231223 RepID=A0AAE0ZSH5_9GAST|nr:hypothetical protein RRG08_034881 [Elysia crispata]
MTENRSGLRLSTGRELHADAAEFGPKPPEHRPWRPEHSPSPNDRIVLIQPGYYSHLRRQAFYTQSISDNPGQHKVTRGQQQEQHRTSMLKVRGMQCYVTVLCFAVSIWANVTMHSKPIADNKQRYGHKLRMSTQERHTPVFVRSINITGPHSNTDGILRTIPDLYITGPHSNTDGILPTIPHL